MWKFFSIGTKKGAKVEIKNKILKEYFNSSSQKKTVLKAAKDSAKDQRDLLSKYKELVSKQEMTV